MHLGEFGLRLLIAKSNQCKHLLVSTSDLLAIVAKIPQDDIINWRIDGAMAVCNMRDFWSVGEACDKLAAPPSH